MNKIYILLIISLFIGCRPSASPIDLALNKAKENKKELEKVLTYYPKGSLKHKAAIFLIENMTYQYSSTGKHVSDYRDSLFLWNGTASLDTVWKKIYERELPEEESSRDVETITANYLIKNIEQAFTTWESVPWHTLINFDQFCNYILPYKIKNEPLVEWRTRLHNKYAPLIVGITDPQKAYEIIYNKIYRDYKVKKVSYPFKRDAIMLDIQQMGECDERAAYVVYVMRSLGIMAGYDFTPIWANYSDIAHTWVVYVDQNNKTHFYSDSTLSSKKNNFIDGTVEFAKYQYNKSSFPYSIDSLKKIAKIFRNSYSITQNPSMKHLKQVPPLMKDVYSYDVTGEYNAASSYKDIPLDKEIKEDIYFCTFKQQEGWVAIAKIPHVDRKKIHVKNIYDEIVGLLAIYKNGIMIPVSNPIIFYKNKPAKELRPCHLKSDSLLLRRKYLLLTRWINRWGEAICSRFETSNNRNFDVTNENKLLHKIDYIPIEKNIVSTKGAKNKRYIRFIPENDKYPVLAELEFYTTDSNGNKRKIPCNFYAHGKDLDGDTLVVKSLYDNNLNTVFLKRFPHWIGVDLGPNPCNVTEICFYMWNDQNQIIQGDEYELLYYDYGWHSLGKQIAQKDYLFYKNIPNTALFLLKNRAGGKEERIFTYENGKQIWW